LGGNVTAIMNTLAGRSEEIGNISLNGLAPVLYFCLTMDCIDNL